jgi:hypothetical protein
MQVSSCHEEFLNHIWFRESHLCLPKLNEKMNLNQSPLSAQNLNAQFQGASSHPSRPTFCVTIQNIDHNRLKLASHYVTNMAPARLQLFSSLPKSILLPTHTHSHTHTSWRSRIHYHFSKLNICIINVAPATPAPEPSTCGAGRGSNSKL